MRVLTDAEADACISYVMGPVPDFVVGGRAYPMRRPSPGDWMAFADWLAAEYPGRPVTPDRCAAAVMSPVAQAKLVSIVLTADGHPECTPEACAAAIEARVREMLTAAAVRPAAD